MYCVFVPSDDVAESTPDDPELFIVNTAGPEDCPTETLLACRLVEPNPFVRLVVVVVMKATTLWVPFLLNATSGMRIIMICIDLRIFW